MTFTQSVSNGLNNFFSARGRSTRSEFWWYYLFCIILGFVIFSCFYFIFQEDTAGWIIGTVFDFILNISMIFIMIRRLHDVGKSGWNILWSLIPFGGFYVLYLLCKKSQNGTNKWNVFKWQK